MPQLIRLSTRSFHDLIRFTYAILAISTVSVSIFPDGGELTNASRMFQMIAVKQYVRKRQLMRYIAIAPGFRSFSAVRDRTRSTIGCGK